MGIRRRRRLVVGCAGLLVALSTVPALALQPARRDVLAWGINNFSELGQPNTGPQHCDELDVCSKVPVTVAGLTDVSAVAAGLGYTLALRSDGTVVGWGDNSSGALGNGNPGFAASSPGPVCAPGETARPCRRSLANVVAIAAGATHALALRSDGSVVAWGSNECGALGDGTTTNRDVPVIVQQLRGVKAISAGFDHSLAVLSDGTVRAWGLNFSGQLGVGNTGGPVDCIESEQGPEHGRPFPNKVRNITNAVAVAAGNGTSLALRSDGTVAFWGFNGPIDFDEHLIPGPVAGLSNVVAIAAGRFSHFLALGADGTVQAWGDNQRGQLGLGTSTGPENCGDAAFPSPCSRRPLPVPGLTGVVAIAAGADDSFALKGDGTVRGWGTNSFGELGTGGNRGPARCSVDTACAIRPVAVKGLGQVVAISAGYNHTVAIRRR